MTAESSRRACPPWPPQRARDYVERGYWAGIPLGERIRAAISRDPAAVRLVDGDLRLTGTDLLARADGAALALRALGLRAGDRIVVQLPNRWYLVVLLLACLRAGVVPVLALPGHRRSEIEQVAAATGARALAVAAHDRGTDLAVMAADVTAAVPTVAHLLVAGAADPGRDLLALCSAEDAPAGALDADAPRGSDDALFLLSGGTTGAPKLIARTHDDLGCMIGHAAAACGLDHRSVYLAALPVAHGFALLSPGVLGTLAAGGRVVLSGSPAPERALGLIAAEGVTVTSAVPAVLQRWLADRAGCRAVRSAPATLSLLQVGGARLPDGLAARVGPDLGCTLQQAFGMSEGMLFLTRPDDPPEVILHSQGRPVCPGDEIRVVDAAGAPVAPGRPGLLLVRGPYTVGGYYRCADADARAFADGWYRTGDLVRVRPDGNIVVTGREKDVVNRGGEKIAAAEVEDHALRVAGVRAAAVVPAPDPELGERVCLCAAADRPPAALLAAVRAGMTEAGAAPFKLPERILVLPALPLTPVGKVDKKALGALVARAGAGAPVGFATEAVAS